MKLVSCHIENFGKISGKDIAFDGGLTSVCEDNGYGKSTIAAFLKAMFYGMESTRKNGKFSDRAHYLPFDGGIFGGNVVFLYRGKTYKVERVFDKTSETHDELSVYLDGVPFDGFKNGVGEEIFGINRESFERTAFVTDEESELSATDDIGTKLNNFIEGGNDDAGLQSALARIEKRAKEYKKQKLSAGLIQDESVHINDLKDRLSNVNSVRAGLPEKYERLGLYERKINELNSAISAAQSENVVRANWENYGGILKDIEAIKNKIAAVNESYPYGIPSDKETEEVSACIETLKRLDALSEKKTFTDEDGARYLYLSEEFSHGVPTENEIKEKQEKIERLHKLETEGETLRKGEPIEEEKELCRAFSANVPTDEELATLQDKLKRYGECGVVSSPAVRKSPSYKPNAVVAVAAAIVLTVGIALLFVQTAIGAAVAAIGAVALLADGFFYLNKKTGSVVRGDGTQTEDGATIAARREREKLAAEIGAVASAYGYPTSDGLEYAAAAFLSDCRRYKSVAARLEKTRQTLTENEEKTASLKEELDGFFSRFAVNSDGYISRITRLRTDISDFVTLKKRKENSEAEENEARKSVADMRGKVAAFCNKYGVCEEEAEERVKIAREDYNLVVAEGRRLKEREADAENFRRDKNLSARPQGDTVDLEEMNRRLTDLQGDKGKLALEIASDEADVERGEELNGELEKSKERLKEYKQNYELLVKTAELLTAADTKLKDKYIRPIRDKFKSYSALIERALGEKIVMDTNFNVRFEYGGMERREGHLSAGQKSVCALCFRLALIDNMYADEKPFLILDDPFVHLDARHFERVKTVMRDVGQSVQILYFTCHKSREID